MSATITAAALREGIILQKRVIYALLLREIRARFGQKRIGYAWALVEPAMHIGVIYAMKELLGGLAPLHLPLLLWLISGIVPYFMFRQICNRLFNAAASNSDVLVISAVRLIDVVLSRTLLEMATYCAILTVFTALFSFIVAPAMIADPLKLMVSLLILALLGMSYGMLWLVITSLFPSSTALMGGIQRVLYFASGVFFSVSHVPYEWQRILALNPLLHIFESIHAAFFASYRPIPWASDLGYAAAFGCGLWVVSFLLMRRYHRQIMDA